MDQTEYAVDGIKTQKKISCFRVQYYDYTSLVTYNIFQGQIELQRDHKFYSVALLLKCQCYFLNSYVHHRIKQIIMLRSKGTKMFLL